MNLPDAKVREAQERDVWEIQKIYSPIVRQTPISFELEPPSAEEIADRIQRVQQWAPWLVLKQGEALQGYAYATRHRQRAAYQWSVDVSVYVSAHQRRQGVARRLYLCLFSLLRFQGFINAYAGIALPNPASVGLHESLGFVPLGVYRNVGYKLGQWHDVGWWSLELSPRSRQPSPPRPPAQLRSHPEWNQLLATA